MLKQVVLTLATILVVVAFPSTVGAATIVGPPYFLFDASLTKVGEHTYDFNYGCGFDESAILNDFYPDATGHPYFYFLDFNYAASGVSGEFGIPTDLIGFGASVGPNYYWAGGEFPWSAWSGSFRITQAPGVISMWGDVGVTRQELGPDGGRNLAAIVEGRANLFGDIPTAIGQTTQWAVTPEPSTWLLLGLGLVPFLGFRRRPEDSKR